MENQTLGRVYGAFIVLLACIFLLPLLWYGFGEGQGLYSYGAWIWRHHGQEPYSHCFDQNFPGIFIIHYFAQSAFGESVTGFRAFDLLWQSATVLMIYLISAKIFKNRVSALIAASFYSISYVDLGAWNTGQRDGFLLLPYLLSFWLFIKSESEKPGLVAVAISGLLIGFAFMVKPIAAPMAMVLLGFILKNAKSKILSLPVFILAGALPFLSVVFYYWRLGSLEALYQALFVFSFKIYSGSLVFNLEAMLNGIFLRNYLLSNSLILLGAVLLIALRKRIPEENKTYLPWLLLMFLAAYLGYLGQAKYFFYHQAPVWGLLCLFAGGGWGLTIDLINQKWPSKTRARTFFLTTALVLTTILLIKPYVHEYLVKALRVSPLEGQRMYPYYDVCFQTASYIEQKSKPEDKLQVWGGEAIVNYLARRQAPSRFSSTLYFIFRPAPNKISPFQRELARELLDALKKDPPLYFVVELLPHPVFGIASEKGVLVEDYPEIWEFISQNYSLEKKISFMEIHRRKQ